jgi:hypothetical protein
VSLEIWLFSQLHKRGTLQKKKKTNTKNNLAEVGAGKNVRRISGAAKLSL